MITTAEETAALAANEALPERIIDAMSEGPLRRPVKPKQAQDLPRALE
jgi:hypothetical protein